MDQLLFIPTAFLVLTFDFDYFVGRVPDPSSPATTTWVSYFFGSVLNVLAYSSHLPVPCLGIW